MNDRIKPAEPPSETPQPEPRRRAVSVLGTKTPPPPAKVEPKQVRESKAAVKCIYFQDARTLRGVEELAERFPSSSVSALVQQLVKGLLEAVKGLPADERGVQCNFKVWL